MNPDINVNKQTKQYITRAKLPVFYIAWDNLWESRGGSMVNGAPREFPESTQCTP